MSAERKYGIAVLCFLFGVYFTIVGGYFPRQAYVARGIQELTFFSFGGALVCGVLFLSLGIWLIRCSWLIARDRLDPYQRFPFLNEILPR